MDLRVLIDDDVPIEEVADLLEKHVLAHISHTQTRTRRGKFTRITHPGQRAPRTGAGKFAPRLTEAERQHARQEAQSVIDTRLRPRLEADLNSLRSHAFGERECLHRMGREIGEYYERIYRLGAQFSGHPAVILQPHDKAALNRLVKDELGFLKKFLADVTMGLGKVPYAQRMGYYAGAANEAFWFGYVLSDTSPSRQLRWVLGPTEHCSDCARFAAMGWTPVQSFIGKTIARGFAPQSGQLECLGLRCQCSIEQK